MTSPPSPTGLPPATPGVIAARLVAVVAVCAVMIGIATGAGHLRARYVHEPACSPVCAATGMRYEGVTQYKKVDIAAACVCVGPRGERAVVATRFFSSVWVLDAAAGFFTSTLGVLLLLGFVGLAGYGAARSLRRG